MNGLMFYGMNGKLKCPASCRGLTPLILVKKRKVTIRFFFNPYKSVFMVISLGLSSMNIDIKFLCGISTRSLISYIFLTSQVVLIKPVKLLFRKLGGLSSSA